MNKCIIKYVQSQQVVGVDELADGQFVTPFFDFDALLKLYYENTYHRRCINIKANLLSQIAESDLQTVLPPGINPKYFLKSAIIQAEIFGNLFLEKAGTDNMFCLYLIPGHEARVDKDRKIYQYLNGNNTEIPGFHFRYYSPISRYYGEPDYMPSIRKMRTEVLIDLYNETFFSNSATPDMGIIFENADPSDEQISAFRQFFQNSFKGYANAHKTLIASTGTGEKDARIRIEAINKVNDLSFEKFKNMNRDEIIAAHSVPPRLVGIITAGQLGGGGELIGQLHQFNELEIKPKIDLYESFFNGLGIRLKLKPIDVTNFKEDASVIGGLVEMGIISTSEAREILGWQKTL